MIKTLNEAQLNRIREASASVAGTNEHIKYDMECSAKNNKGKWLYVGFGTPNTQAATIKKVKDTYYIIEETGGGVYRFAMNDAVIELLGLKEEDKQKEKEKPVMSKQQIKVFNELLESADFKGKKSLKHLLWLNTSKPKFEIGNCFKVTEHGHRVYGKQVIDFNAKIVRIYSMKDENEWYYELDMICKCGDKETTVKQYAAENELRRRADGNINIIAGDIGKGEARFI